MPQFAIPKFAIPQFAILQFAILQFAIPQFAIPQFAVPQFAIPQYQYLYQPPLFDNFISLKYFLNRPQNAEQRNSVSSISVVR
jgi:hypothetical protein